MALEDILEQREKLGEVNEIMERAGKGDYEAPILLGNLAHKQEETFPADFYRDKTVFDVNQGARAFARNYQDNIAEKVKEDYKEVLDNLKENKLVSLALSVKPSETGDKEHDEKAKKHKKYLDENEKYEKKDLESYVQGITHPAVKEIFNYHLAIDPNRILRAYAGYIQSLQDEFIREFEYKDEKNKGKLQSDKLKDYLIRNTDKLGDEDKKHAYLTAGLLLEKKEEEAEEKDEMKKAA